MKDSEYLWQRLPCTLTLGGNEVRNEDTIATSDTQPTKELHYTALSRTSRGVFSSEQNLHIN
jgi:hypothetical protein